MRYSIKLIAFVASVLLWSPCCAGPTGLIVIPTADVMEAGTYELEFQHDGEQGFPVDSGSYFLNTQFGLVRRVEAGVDFDLSSEHESLAALNAKYAFPIKEVPVAVGVYNIGNHLKPISYAVTGTRWGKFGLHLGTQLSDDRFELLAGAHHELGRLLVMADYTSGDENFASAGFEYALSDHFTVQWGALLPNSNEGKTGFTLHIIYTSLFRH